MSPLFKFVVAALAASLATATPLARRLAAGNSSLINTLKQNTQVAKITSLINEQAFEYLDGPVMRVTSPDVPGMPHNPEQENWLLPNPQKIADALRSLARY